MSKTLRVVDIQIFDGAWANLGKSALATAVAQGLKAQFGGSVVRRDGATLYYNGACDVPGEIEATRGLYQVMVDQVVR